MKGQEGARKGAKRSKMKLKWRQREGNQLGAPFWGRKSGQHGSKMVSKIEPKSMHKSIKKRRLTRSIFDAMFVKFGMKNGDKLAPKLDQKSIVSSKRRKAKQHYESPSLTIVWILGVQVGSKHRSKNEVNIGRHLGIDVLSIWVDYWSHVGSQDGTKIDPKRHRKT